MHQDTTERGTPPRLPKQERAQHQLGGSVAASRRLTAAPLSRRDTLILRATNDTRFSASVSRVAQVCGARRSRHDNVVLEIAPTPPIYIDKPEWPFHNIVSGIPIPL